MPRNKMPRRCSVKKLMKAIGREEFITLDSLKTAFKEAEADTTLELLQPGSIVKLKIGQNGGPLGNQNGIGMIVESDTSDFPYRVRNLKNNYTGWYAADRIELVTEIPVNVLLAIQTAMEDFKIHKYTCS